MNEVLAQNNPSCMFVTIGCGVLDTSTGEVRYANAGHLPPLLLRPLSRLPPLFLLRQTCLVKIRTPRKSSRRDSTRPPAEHRSGKKDLRANGLVHICKSNVPHFQARAALFLRCPCTRHRRDPS